MKKVFTTLLIAVLMVFTGYAYAHEHHHDADSASVTNSNSLSADNAMQHEMEKHAEMEAVDAFPNFHPLIVHFPVVLLIIATLFQFLSFFVFRKELSWVTLILLALGVITAWLSSNTFHADPDELTGRAKEIFETHELMADLTWWFSFIALLVKAVSHYFLKRKILTEIIVSILLATSAVTVSIAAHHGAMLVHMEGIGPKGNHLENDEHHHEE